MRKRLSKSPIVIPADDVPGPEQGHWTYNDYANLDDGQGYEVVNGILYKRPSPYTADQKAALRVAHYLLTHIELAGLGRVFTAPLAVELAPNVVVQPDVSVVLNTGHAKITQTHIMGIPDLVVEVSAPGTEDHEYNVKNEAYFSAGVPEYWIVDPWWHVVQLFIQEDSVQDDYRHVGYFEGKETVPSKVAPEISVVPVEQFFAYPEEEEGGLQ